MQPVVKKIAVIFAAATVGGGIGYYFGSNKSVSPDTQTENALPPAQKTPSSTYTVEGGVFAEVLDNQGDSLITVRMHSWPGQYMRAQVTPERFGRYASGAEFKGIFKDENGRNVAHPKPGDLLGIAQLQSRSDFPASFIKKQRPQRDVIPGPVPATVTKRTDGDTFDVELVTYDGSVVVTSVRIMGIDTPEKGKKAKCDHEAALAKEASAETARLIASGKVVLRNIKLDKYAGRVDADVYNDQGVNVGETLIAKGLAKPYQGKTKKSWCDPRP